MFDTASVLTKEAQCYLTNKQNSPKIKPVPTKWNKFSLNSLLVSPQYCQHIPFCVAHLPSQVVGALCSERGLSWEKSCHVWPSLPQQPLPSRSERGGHTQSQRLVWRQTGFSIDVWQIRGEASLKSSLKKVDEDEKNKGPGDKRHWQWQWM